MKVVFATKNKDKLKEVREILAPDFEVISMTEAGVDIDVEEDGTTFEENAIKKAETVMKLCGEITIADDSGLEVDFLNGEPGVYSSRYMGEDTPYTIKNQAIIDRLKDARGSQRSPRYTCAVAVALPGKYTLIVQESSEGEITKEPKGDNGFGYDPIFYVQRYSKTMAELTMEQKNKISHRGKAFRAVAERLRSIDFE